MVIVFFACPFSLIPIKDAVEELTTKRDVVFTFFQNFLCTLGIIAVCYLITIPVADIGDAMSILGPTTNTAVGFLIPIIFWLKFDRISESFEQVVQADEELFSLKTRKKQSHEKLTKCQVYTGYAVFGLVCVASVL